MARINSHDFPVATAAAAATVRSVRRAAAFAWVLCACAGIPGAQGAPRLIVVNSADVPMYSEAVAGMRLLPGTAVEASTLGKDNAALGASIAAAGHETAVVALGNGAGDFVAHLAPTLPVVHCMVSGDAASALGGVRVPLAIPVATQVHWLKRLLPAAHTVAILYSPGNNTHAANAAIGELTADGYTVLAQAVSKPADLPQALQQIAKADALLALPDPGVYTPELAQGLLLFTYRSHMPLVATTRAWVRAGALYGLEWKYADVGTYCGALALQALGPAAAGTPPPRLPEPTATVNMHIAAQLRITWSAAELSGVEKLGE
jgi:putative ABC transport system substrate-binding protein